MGLSLGGPARDRTEASTVMSHALYLLRYGTMYPLPYILHTIIPTYTVNKITLYCRYYITRACVREGSCYTLVARVLLAHVSLHVMIQALLQTIVDRGLYALFRSLAANHLRHG